MPSRIKRAKPSPGQPDDWNTPVAPPEPVPPKPVLPEPSFEDTLYQILYQAFGRSDSAARAVARLGYQLALRQAADTTVTETIPLDGKPDQGSAVMMGSGREFDEREFLDTFERLSFLRMVLDLIEALQLDPVAPALVRAVIDDRFGTKGQPSRSAPDTKTVAGSDMSVLVHNIKQMAERRARSEFRSSPQRSRVGPKAQAGGKG